MERCSRVSKQWSELCLPLLDRMLRISTANMDGILSFIRQSPIRRSYVSRLYVNFPSSPQRLGIVGTALWNAFREILEIVGGQLIVLDVLLWKMDLPPPEARIRLPSTLKNLFVRTSFNMKNPILQDWFTGFDECNSLVQLQLWDVRASQPTPTLLRPSYLLISAMLPSDFAFFSAAAQNLASLEVFRSDDFGADVYPEFWPDVFKLLHLIKDSLQYLDLDRRFNTVVDSSIYPQSYIEPQLVAPILPHLLTLKLYTTDFLGDLVDVFPHLPLSSHLVRLKLYKAPIVSVPSDAQLCKFQCKFQELKRLTILQNQYDVSAHTLRPVFDPITHPHRLTQLETSLKTFVSKEEAFAFFQMSQPRRLDIDIGNSFKALDFLLSSGETIPDIQQMSISGNFHKNSRRGNNDFDSSDFTKGFCAAKRLQFKFHVERYSSSVDPKLIGNGGYAPLFAFLLTATWTDQLERLIFGPVLNDIEVASVLLKEKESVHYEGLMSRLGESCTEVICRSLEFRH
ncbi:hypothetical protein BT69DRAFT_1285501 [Atractiella rhizophila]|nr:hypothetical protein BT69DRAFT_1285501 [Atractiella rhizophila]